MNSQLVNSEFCQNCAKCCREFVWADSPSMALRLKWLLENKVKIERMPFVNKDGKPLDLITILIPCKKLGQHSTGKYYCKAYNEKRPDCCKTYPDHVFIDAFQRSKDKAFLEEVRKEESKSCPFLKNYSIEGIIDRLELEAKK